AALGEQYDKVEHGRRGFSSTVALFQKALDAARRLPDALLVLDEGNAHIAFALIAEADARTDRHLRFGKQPLREFQRPHRAELFGNRSPGEHAGLRRRDLPAGAPEALDQAVAPRPVKLAIEIN